MRAKRKDKNQNEIAEQAQKLGISYQDLSMVGNGCADALFGYGGVNIYAEIKDGKNDLNNLQVEYHDNWAGQIVVIRDIVDLVKEFSKHIDNSDLYFDLLDMLLDKLENKINELDKNG